MNYHRRSGHPYEDAGIVVRTRPPGGGVHAESSRRNLPKAGADTSTEARSRRL
jgi:hypothetical protein